MRLFTAFVFFLFVSVCDAQVMFQKTYGGPENDWCGDVKIINGSDFILTGATRSFGNTYYDTYLMRINVDGDTLWTKAYNLSPYDDGAHSVQQTNDGGFIITGDSYDSITGGRDIALIKTDINGNNLWIKTYGEIDQDGGYDVQQTNDGGYIIAGWTLTSGFFPGAYLIRTNSLGDTLWTKVYRDSTLNIIMGSILENADGSFTVCYENSNADNDLLMKIDAGGNVIWSKIYGSRFLSSVIHTSNGFIICGAIRRFGFTDSDIGIIKVNFSGDTLWTRTYGTSDDEEGTDVQSTSDGGYIISGYRYNGFYTDACLVKIDNSGNLLWAKSYGGANNDWGLSVTQTTDGGYALVGMAYSFGSGNQDVYLVKTNSSGISGCNETSPAFMMSYPQLAVNAGNVTTLNPATIVSTLTVPALTPPTQQTTLCYTVGIEEMNDGENGIMLFPNPATNEFTIKNAELKIKAVEIYNVLGEKIFRTDVTAGNRDVLTINTAEFTSGIYFVSIKTAGGIVAKKLVVQR